jgi:multicomponent Na+:H+ antiporter subunit F
MNEFLLFAAFVVLAAAGVGLLRLLWGPARADRIMSAQLLGTGGIAALLLIGAAMNTPAAADVGLALALLAAFASAAFAKAAMDSDAAQPEDSTEA